MDSKKILRGKIPFSSATPLLLFSSPPQMKGFPAGYVPMDPSEARDSFPKTSHLPLTVFQELEMHQMKEQMIAAEVQRRLEIEAEVRKEMAAREAIGTEMTARKAIGRYMSAREVIEKEMATKEPMFSPSPRMMTNQSLLPSNYSKGKQVDALPVSHNSEGMVTEGKTSPQVENKMTIDLTKVDGNILKLKRKAPSSPPPPPLDISPWERKQKALLSGYVPMDPSEARDSFPKTSHLPLTVFQELEMHQMKEQMIAAEVQRRLEIEAEVRKEMAAREAIGTEMTARKAIGRYMSAREVIEKEMATKEPMFSPSPRMMTNQSLLPSNYSKGKQVDALPVSHNSEGMVTEGKTSPQVENKMTIDLTKVDGNILKLKRKAPSSPPPPLDISPWERKRKALLCELCDVSTTSEEQLQAHLKGKKHLSNELKKANGSCSKFALKQMIEKQSNSSGDVRDDDMVSKKTEKQGVNYPFWCVVCKIGTSSMEGLEAHLKGKEHVSMVLKDIA